MREGLRLLHCRARLPLTYLRLACSLRRGGTVRVASQTMAVRAAARHVKKCNVATLNASRSPRNKPVTVNSDI